MQQQQQHVVTLRIDRFMLDESARPSGSTGERALLSKSFCAAWSFVSQGPQSLLGCTPVSSFHAFGSQLVCDWRGFQGEVILDSSVLSNFSARVLVLRIVEMESNGAAGNLITASDCMVEHVATRLRALYRGNTAAFASATIDPGSFVKKPPRDYCVKMEANFTTVGKLYFHMSVESLEMKRFAERTVIEKRLMLRVDRVVTSRTASSVKSPKIGSVGRNGETPASSTRSSPQAPPLVPSFSGMRTTSDMSTTSTEGSIGPLHSSTSSMLRPGFEYVVKLRLNCSREIHRTPLSICDADGRVRWGYELTVPLPTVKASFPGHSCSSSGDGDDGSGAPSHAVPLPLSADRDDTMSISSSSPGTPHEGGRLKLQAALMEGQQVVSSFAIDVAKLKSSKEWTEYVIPSPYSAVRREKDGTASTASGTVLFEISVRQAETLRLQRRGDEGGAVTATGSKGTSGRSTPIHDDGTAHHQLARENAAFRSSEGLLPAPTLVLGGGEEAALRTTTKDSATAALAPLAVASPTKQSTRNPQHTFGDSLCSTPGHVVDAAQWTPLARLSPPPSLFQDRMLVLSDNFSPNCATSTLPPTPQVQSSVVPATGAGAMRRTSMSDSTLGTRSDTTSPTPPLNLQHTMRLESPMEPPQPHETPIPSVRTTEGPTGGLRRRHSDDVPWGPNDNNRSMAPGAPASTHVDNTHDALLRRVEAQDKCISELQRQLATLQASKSPTPMRSESMMSASQPSTEGTVMRNTTGWATDERAPSVATSESSRRAAPRRTHSLSREEPHMHTGATEDSASANRNYESRNGGPLQQRVVVSGPSSSAGNNAMRTPPKLLRGATSSPLPHDPRGGPAAPRLTPGLPPQRIGTSSHRDVL